MTRAAPQAAVAPRGVPRRSPGAWTRSSRKCLDPDPARRYAAGPRPGRGPQPVPRRPPAPPRPRAEPARAVRQVGAAEPQALRDHVDRAGLATLLVLMLGGLIGLLHGNMQNLSTAAQAPGLPRRVHRVPVPAQPGQRPRRAPGPGDRPKAQRVLDQQGIDRSGDWRADSWVRRLTPREQDAVREQTAELILLEARARVFLAERAGSEADAEAGAGVGRRLAGPGRASRPEPARGTLRRPGAVPVGAGPRRPRRGGPSPRGRRRPDPQPRLYPARQRLPGPRRPGRAPSRALRQAVDLDPRGFWAWFALGHCHFEQGRALEAAGRLRRLHRARAEVRLAPHEPRPGPGPPPAAWPRPGRLTTAPWRPTPGSPRRGSIAPWSTWNLNDLAAAERGAGAGVGAGPAGFRRAGGLGRGHGALGRPRRGRAALRHGCSAIAPTTPCS